MSRSGRTNLQTGVQSFTYLGGGDLNPDMSAEIARRTRACWMHIRRYLRELYDQPKVALSFKTRMVKAEAVEALLYGCSTRTLCQEHYSEFCAVHYRDFLLRIIGAQRKRSFHRMASYNGALETAECGSIETILRTRRTFWSSFYFVLFILPALCVSFRLPVAPVAQR